MQKKASLPGKNVCTNILDIGSFGFKTWDTCERLAKTKNSPFFLKAFSCELGKKSEHNEKNLTVVLDKGDYCSYLQGEPSGFYHQVHLHAPGGITTRRENGFDGFASDINRIMKPGAILFASADFCFSVYSFGDETGIRALYDRLLPHFNIMLSLFDKCLASGFTGGNPIGKNFIDKEAMHGLFRLFDYGAPKDVKKMPEIIRDFFGLFSVNNNDMDYFMIAKKK